MNSNSIGNIFKFHSFGESHGPAMGVVIEGCPSGLSVSTKVLQQELDRRRPGKQAWTSSRKELDTAEIVSGVFNGKTLGTPISVLVFNKDQRSKDYDQIKKQARKGHSEDLWKVKFGLYDHRGGGRASGRETVARVIAGAFARMLIKKLCPHFKVMAFVKQIEQIALLPHDLKTAENLFKRSKTVDSFTARMPHKEKSKQALDLLMQAKKEGDSLGSLLELWIENLPKGLGQPLFHKFKSDLAQSIMSLGASTALEIGLGKDSAKMKGSQFHLTKTNYGGIRGGLTTGERVIVRVVFKPPSSLGKTAKKGRFDPCIGPRAVPVLEAIACLITADHLLWKRLDQI
ncbi:MAG: chorismate synthase [Bdellovibrionaceae bacterium]|nr:chorismate synthase [Pseudobdellovibrionaceae bacterium]